MQCCLKCAMLGDDLFLFRFLVEFIVACCDLSSLLAVRINFLRKQSYLEKKANR